MFEIPKISSVMTPSPKTIEASQPVREVRRMMQDFGIHHVPVTLAGSTIGVLSERDLSLADHVDSAGERFVEAGELCIKDALYQVGPDTPLDEVTLHMANQGIGSALVVEHGQLLGIFTVVDACRELGDRLRGAAIRS
jgi:acetoin utilization protein AcuB